MLRDLRQSDSRQGHRQPLDALPAQDGSWPQRDSIDDGEKISKDDPFGVVESVKAVSDIYAPVSGEIAEVNPALSATPELVNQDPYNKGWLYKMKNCNIQQMNSLMDAAAYEATWA